MRCLPGKHVWVTRTEFNGTQYEQCTQCGASRPKK